MFTIAIFKYIIFNLKNLSYFVKYILYLKDLHPQRFKPTPL